MIFLLTKKGVEVPPDLGPTNLAEFDVILSHAIQFISLVCNTGQQFLIHKGQTNSFEFIAALPRIYIEVHSQHQNA